MPTCAMHPQPSQFDPSQPLSQGHAMSQPDSQECSFGGGAPLRVVSLGAGASAPTGAGSQPSLERDEVQNVSERQEMDDEDDAEAEAQDSQALLEVCAPRRVRLRPP